eukprot:jgi/Tetstr1/459470/TSEL_004837.t1
MADAGKAAAVGGVGTTGTEQDPIEAARRKAEDIRLKQLIHEHLSMFFITKGTHMPLAAAGEEDAIPGGNGSRAGGQDQNVRAPFVPSSEPHYVYWKTALATALAVSENGMPPDSFRRLVSSPMPSTVCPSTCLVTLASNRQQMNTSYHAACYGAFIAGSTVELRQLLAAACVTEGITPAFGQRLEAIVHSMEAIDDGHRFRLAYLRKQWDT